MISFRKLCVWTNLVVLVLLLSCPSAWAQATGGSISGTVTDPTGAVVPGASVTALNLDTTVQQSTTTNAEGFYAFTNLNVGRYEVQVKRVAFQPVRRSGLVIDIGTKLRVDVGLSISTQTLEVVISAETPQVETQETQMGQTIGSAKIDATPLNGRSYTDMLNLQAGVVPVTTQQANSIIMAGVTYTPPSGDLNPGNISVSGQRENSNAFIVNGSNVEEDVNMGTAVIPNLDSIAEFRILTNNFDAQYGNFSGGQIIVTTKSGTSRLHGDAFDFVRNTVLDAKSYFSTQRPAFDQQQFGGTMGGPVKHKKIFWFVDYQGTRTTEGVDTGLISVPSLADRTGNLSGLAGSFVNSNGQPTTVSTSYLASMLSSKLGYAIMQGEPYYTPGCTSSATCVFPATSGATGPVIPARAWSAPATFLLNYIPPPNVGANQFETAAFDETIRDDKGGLRLDADTRWGTLSAYYFADDYTLNNPYPTGQGGANVPSGMGGDFNALSRGRAQLLSLGDIKSFGANDVNEFHFSYMRSANNIGRPAGGVGVPLACQGFVTAVNESAQCPGSTTRATGIYPLDPSIEGIENVALENMGFTIGTPITNAIQTNNTYQWLDNFSKVIGTHTLKFGGEFHYDQVNEVPNATFNGSFQFNGSETGSDFADFLLGIASVYVQADQGAFYPRNKYAGFFGQDSWRVKPKLTLNYGLRWDIIGSWYEKYNQLNTLVPGQQSVVYPGAPTGFLVPGDPGVSRTISPTRYTNFAPRLALAYAPDFKNELLHKIFGGADKSSIRAGYGIFYTAIPGLSAAIMYSIAPYGYNYVPNSVLFAQPMVSTNGAVFPQPFPITPPPFGASASNPNSTVDWSSFEPITGDPAYAGNNRIPYSEQYYLSFQRQLSTSLLLTIGYVGSQSHHLLVIVPFNSANPQLCLAMITASPGSCGPDNDNQTRPLWPYFGGDSLQETIGNASYNALEASLRYAGAQGEFLAGYTYSRCIDNSSTLAEEVDAIDPNYTRALCSFDLRHNFVISYKYNLPVGFLLRRHDRLAEGWSLSGTTRLSTGLPVTMYDNNDDSLLGTNPNGVNNSYLDLPNVAPGPLNLNYNPAKGPAFNTSLFSRPALGTLGDSPRRFFDGPGLVNFDMALLKVVPLKETKSLQIRAEAYNIFNHAQFFGPASVDGSIGSPEFGRIVSAMPARIMQLGVKFLF